MRYTHFVNRYSVFGVLTAVLFALLPFATSRHLFHGAVNAKYFLVVGAVLLLAGISTWAYFHGKLMNFRNRPFLWVGAGLLAVYWLSAIFGIFPERSIFADIQRSTGVFFLTHIAALAFILGEYMNERDWTLLRRTIALSSALFGFFTMLGAEGFMISGRILWSNLDINGFTFGNSTFAGTYLLLALVVVLIELTRTPVRSRWWYALAASATFIFFSPILSSLWNIEGVFADPLALLGSARASSAATILLLVFFGGYLFLRTYAGGDKKHVLLAWGALFATAILAATALLLTPGSVVQEKYMEASTGARLLVWQGGFAALIERPLLGWGSENFEQALQKHLDNRLYEDEHLVEIWFDRAHNVVVDTLVDVGVLGVVAYLLLIGAFVRTVYRAHAGGLIGEAEMVLLCALPFAHFLQLQTGFDTIGSFTLLGALGGYSLWLEHSMYIAEEKNKLSHTQGTYHKVGAAVLGLLVLVSVYLSAVELNRQYVVFRTFISTNYERQLELAEAATSRISSFESLRVLSSSLIKGVLGRIAEKKADAEDISAALAQLNLYEGRYLRYIEEQPGHYRARMNLAYLFSVETVLGENKLREAKEVIADARELAPQSLITPAMEALLELYSGNLTAAKAKAEEMVALNPNAPFGREVLAHIEKQERTFPEITVLKLENL